MTKSMMARLCIAGAMLMALTLVALQAWGSTSSSTVIDATADRTTSAPPTDGESATAGQVVATSSSSEVEPTEADTANAASANERAPRSAAAGQRTAQTDDDDDDETVTVTLLHNNDGESKLLPDPEAGFPGVARFAQAWVDLGRGTDADILLRVSSGDNFLASKEFSAGLARRDQPLYDSVALRGLYEVMGLGNHDFDFGPDITARFIEGFRQNESSTPVPFVAANIDVSAEPALQALAEEGRIAPSSVFTDPTSGLDIGVIGALTPRLPNISSPRGVVVDADVAGAVNAEAEALMEQGVDRIVLVSHLQGLDEDRALIPQLSGIDIVVAGGGDELLKNDGDTCQEDEPAVAPYPLLLTDSDGNSVPVVTAPGGYRCIGRLDVTFDADGNLVSFEGSSIGIELDGPAEDFAVTQVEEPLAEALAELEETGLGQSEVVLDGRRSSVRTAASNVGELLADALLTAGQDGPDFSGPAAIVAVQNGGGIRNDAEIQPGTITEADTFDIAPFANFVVTGTVTREQFKDMLEVAVAGLPAAEGTFAQIAGFSMDVDADEPARLVDSDGDCSLIGDPGSRVQTVTLDDGTAIVTDGQVVPGDDIALATIDFLANGGDCYPLTDVEFSQVGVSYQQALSRFVSLDLDGLITAADYPIGGSRITIQTTDTTDTTGTDDTSDTGQTTTDDGSPEETNDATNDGETDDGETDDPDSSDGTDDAEIDELPNTGLESSLILVIALTTALAGALIFVEGRRAGWLSLTNRLSATQAWDPETGDEL